MPYIKQDRRNKLDSRIDWLARALDDMDWTAGDLNYCLFKLMRKLFRWRTRYQTLNDFQGALGNVWLEFYRKVGVPYERKKEKENGEIR